MLHIEGSDKLRNVQFNRVTWLKIEAESNLLKSDLYMNPAPMLSVVFAEGLFRFSILYFIVLFAITSFVSGEVAGLVAYSRNRSAKDALQHGALGFVNFLTLLGVLIAAGVYTQRNNYGMKHTFAYAGVFTVVFMILNAIIWYSIIRAYSIY